MFCVAKLCLDVQQILEGAVGHLQVSLSPELLSGSQLLDGLTDGKARMRAILRHARALPAFPEEARTLANRVMGCTAQVITSP
jgi:sulfur transfer protein SufE